MCAHEWEEPRGREWERKKESDSVLSVEPGVVPHEKLDPMTTRS